MTDRHEPHWVTINVAATHLDMQPRTLRRWVEAGVIPHRCGVPRLVDLTLLGELRSVGELPGLRRQPVVPPPPAGLAVSWPEVDLLVAALNDAAQMRAARWAALGGDEAPGVNLDTAARYALMAARLGIARDRADRAAAREDDEADPR
jgi:hypothetical protein